MAAPDELLIKNARETPELPPVEADDPDTASFPALKKVGIKKLKAERKEARRDADSEHSRKRDTYVTIAGLILVLILILIYWGSVSYMPPNSYAASFFDLLKAVIMLIIGYIFGTKITRQ